MDTTTITTTNATSTSSSSSWDLDMTMGANCNHLLLDQIQTPYEILNPLDHQFLPSPTFPPTVTAQFGTTLPRDVESSNHEEDDEEGLGAMKEMVYKIAAMQPIDIDLSTIKKPKRRNVRISDDPQSIAARHRRERISERFRILQRLVPGGTKMDTASMLDEAILYVKFLKRQVQELQANPPPPTMVAHVVRGHPVGSMDWSTSTVTADSHGLGSTSAMGGLGFGFSSDWPSDHRMGGGG